MQPRSERFFPSSARLLAATAVAGVLHMMLA
jgi:hypothetical protein